MPEADPDQPFYLIVTDHDRRVFAVEGPMTDERPWQEAARYARSSRVRGIVVGPTGTDREALAAEYRDQAQERPSLMRSLIECPPRMTPRRRARIRAAAPQARSRSNPASGPTSRATALLRRVMTISSPAS